MIPKDPAMLLSFVNTQLRDKCTSLAEFCSEYDVEESELVSKLEAINYIYRADINQFI